MKIKINRLFEFIGFFLIYISCYLNLPSLAAYVIRISIQKKKFFFQKSKKRDIVVVLDREIGHRDVEIIRDSSKLSPEFLFLRRSITKIILLYFCEKKLNFFNFQKSSAREKDYFNQKKDSRKKHELFWTDIILNLKKYYKNKKLTFVTFNYTYFAEIALYIGCYNNDIPVKLWSKEGIKTSLEAQIEAKTRGIKFNHVFKYFRSISTYNEIVKKMFIKIDKSNAKKIKVNGCPRILDYVIKKKYKRKIKTLLFLSFDTKRGIPKIKKNKNLSWQLSYNKVIDLLNELSKNKNLNILIKRKSNFKDNTHQKINKEIKIYSKGTAENFIHQADIIIGLNSASTIESLVNGKIVMIPFFEKNPRQKKYLYKFNKEIVFSSEKKMRNKILSLVDKKTFFPVNNNKHQKTINYYLGSVNNITENYLRFLSE